MLKLSQELLLALPQWGREHFSDYSPSSMNSDQWVEKTSPSSRVPTPCALTDNRSLFDYSRGRTSVSRLIALAIWVIAYES
jgi:hypothetical protein